MPFMSVNAQIEATEKAIENAVAMLCKKDSAMTLESASVIVKNNFFRIQKSQTEFLTEENLTKKIDLA